jgi:hypothetical protein
MPRKRKPLMPDAPLAPVPSEILDQFVRQEPISPEELDAAVRRSRKRSSSARWVASSRTVSGTRPVAEAGRDHESSQWDRQQDGADR